MLFIKKEAASFRLGSVTIKGEQIYGYLMAERICIESSQKNKKISFYTKSHILSMNNKYLHTKEI